MSLQKLVVPLIVVTVLGLHMRTARAEMLVMESNVPEIKEGVRLPDNAVPVLPPGGRVKVLLASGESKVFERSSATSSRPAQQPFGGMRNPRTPE